MPYSIQTKDGIKINNIPDDVDPNSEELKARVAEIRAKQNPPQQLTESPEDKIRAQLMESGRFVGGSGDRSIFKDMRAAVTGSDRQTKKTKSLPEIGEAPEINSMNFMNGSAQKAFKSSLGLLSTANPESLKGILRQQFGDSVSFSRDEKGNDIVTLPSGEFVLNKPGVSAQDIARFAFDLTAFTPSGRASTVLGATTKAGGAQAAIDATEEGLGGEDFSLTDTLIAGGFGGTGKLAENMIGSAIRLLKERPSNALMSKADELDIPLATSDVIQPKTFAGKSAQQTVEKIPFFGTGDVRAEQQIARESAVQKVLDQYGDFSYSKIIDSLKGQSDKIKKAAGSTLERTAEKLDPLGPLEIPNTKKVIARVGAELSRPGSIPNEGAISALEKVMKAIDQEAPTFTGLKELRTAFRDIVKRIDKDERSQLTSRAKSLLDDVAMAMSSDMEKVARTNLNPNEFRQWKNANSAWADEATKLTKTRLKNVLDKGDVSPDKVSQLLFSRSDEELALLHRSLTPKGREHARAAIIGKIADDLSRQVNGVTPNSFATAMKRHRKQINKFFKGEERARLNALSEVLDATRRAQDASVATPTGQQLIGAATAASVATNPIGSILTGGTLGAAAKLYESDAAKKVLLKMAQAPKGSRAYDRALSEAQSILSANAQALRSQATESQTPPQ